MSDLGGTYTIARTQYLISTIEFSWDDKQHKYNPKPDVTAYELSKLLILVTYGSIAGERYMSGIYSNPALSGFDEQDPKIRPNTATPDILAIALKILFIVLINYRLTILRPFDLIQLFL